MCGLVVHSETHRTHADLCRHCFHSVQRFAIEDWFASGKHLCPKSGVSLRRLNISPNHALKAAIRTWCEATDQQLRYRPFLKSCVNGTIGDFNHKKGSAPSVSRTSSMLAVSGRSQDSTCWPSGVASQACACCAGGGGVSCMCAFVLCVCVCVVCVCVCACACVCEMHLSCTSHTPTRRSATVPPDHHPLLQSTDVYVYLANKMGSCTRSNRRDWHWTLHGTMWLHAFSGGRRPLTD